MDKLKKDNNKSWQKVLLMFLGILILAGGIGGAVLLVKTKPKAKKKKRASMIPVVEVVMLKATDENVVVNAMGTVIPAIDINLQSEVNGRVVWINPNFIEGGAVKKDDILIKVENADYKLALLRRQAQLKIDESNLRLEDGRQDIAKREWEMLNVKSDMGEADLELALRKPQRVKQQALVDAARSDMKQAELMLSRTEIKTPFDALIRRASVNVGDQASLGKVLAQLVGTDTYWVLTSVRVSELKWIAFPDAEGRNGATVKVVLSGNRTRDGVVIRQMPDLESNGRMARLLIAIDDPLGKNSLTEQPQMLLGQYVRVQIKGPVRKDAYRISRGALRDGNELWLLDKDKKLNIVDAEVVWGDKDSIVLNGAVLNDGDKLIMTDLDVVVDGMQLRGVKDKKLEAKGQKKKPKDSVKGRAHSGMAKGNEQK